jgi:hypothetical protein
MIWAAAALLVLLVPRYYLVDIGESGLRIEEVVLLMLVPATVRLLLANRLRFGPVLRAYALYFGVVLLASFAAAAAGKVPLGLALAFGLRPTYYVCGLVLGYHIGFGASRRSPGMVGIAMTVMVVQIAYGAGTSLGLLPNAGSFDPARLSGLTNGPYDLSAMLCLLGVALTAAHKPVWVGVGFLAVIWTQSRVAVAALVLHLVVTSIRARTWVRWTLPTAAVLALTLVVSLRDSESGGLLEAIAASGELRESFSVAAISRADYADTAYSNTATHNIEASGGDLSTTLRVARWSVAIATAMNSTSNLWLGMGPGYYSVALDGNYVRLVGETGLLGLLAYLFLGRQLSRSIISPVRRRLLLAMIMQLAVIGIFVDIFVSLKTMCLFWMMVGALHREEADNKST